MRTIGKILCGILFAVVAVLFVIADISGDGPSRLRRG